MSDSARMRPRGGRSRLRHRALFALVMLAGCGDAPRVPAFWPGGALPPWWRPPTNVALAPPTPAPSPAPARPPDIRLAKQPRCRLAPDGTRLFVRRPFALEARSVPDGQLVWRRDIEWTQQDDSLEVSHDGTQLSDGKQHYAAATGDALLPDAPWPAAPVAGRVISLPTAAPAPGAERVDALALVAPSDVERQRLSAWARGFGVEVADEGGRLVLRSARTLRASADGRAFVLVDTPEHGIASAHVLWLEGGRSYTIRAWRAFVSHYSSTPEAWLEVVPSPDGTRLSVLNTYPVDRALEGTARLYDTATGRVVADVGGRIFSPSSRLLYDVGGSDVFDASTGAVRLVRASPHGDAVPVDLDRAERFIAEGCNVYDLTLGRRVMFVGPLPAYSRALAFLPDGALLDVQELGIVVWDLPRGERLRLLEGAIPDGRSLVMDAALRAAAVATEAGIALVDLAARRVVRVLGVALRPDSERAISPRGSRPSPMAFAPDGSALAVLGDDALELFAWADAAPPRRIALGAASVPGAVAWSDDGARLAVLQRAARRHRLVLIDAARGSVLAQRDLGAVQNDEPSERLGFAKSERVFVAAWPGNGELRAAFDADTGAERPLPATDVIGEEADATARGGGLEAWGRGALELQRTRDGKRLALAELTPNGRDGFIARSDDSFDGAPDAYLSLTAGNYERAASQADAETSRRRGLLQIFAREASSQ